MGLNSPGIDITQFHALPDFGSIPQQTSDNSCNPGSNLNISYHPHLFIRPYAITDLFECLEFSILRSPDHPFLRITSDRAGYSCIWFGFPVVK